MNALRWRGKKGDESHVAEASISPATSSSSLSDAAPPTETEDDKPDASKDPLPDAVWSSGVPFYPPSNKYWRIGNEWYDFTEFAKRHPGGSDALYLSRDRFEDATFVFESHHHNYHRARKIIQKYKVAPPRSTVERPSRSQQTRLKPGMLKERVHFDKDLDNDRHPDLLDDGAFYSVLRQRVTRHLTHVAKCPAGGPTWFCVGLFWFTLALWFLVSWGVYQTGSYALATLAGIVSAWLGGFGHNWVHQPRYKEWGWAQLSLDMVGFSSEAWWREHNLQHHMYTNTPWDNHFRGSDPFLKTDPTVERNFLQKHIMPYVTPVLFCFALYVNYIVNTISLLSGEEVFCIGKLILPAHYSLLIFKWGWIHGASLLFLTHSILCNYYFVLALMNHNTEHCMDVSSRNSSKDWGMAQLQSCADWACHLKFWQAGIYLWLNYHTVHHLFPRVDISHHPAIHKILVETCREFGVTYEVSTFGKVYKEMIQSFNFPRALGSEILVYAGGI